MVFGLGKGKKREQEEAAQYQKDMAVADQSRPVMPGQREAIDSLGEKVYMFMSPRVDEIILNDPILKASYPAYDPLNRVTKIGNRQAEIDELDYDEFPMIAKMNMTEDEYETKGWLLLKAMRKYGRTIVSDAFGGFKAEIVAITRKTIRTELAEEKKKGRFF